MLLLPTEISHLINLSVHNRNIFLFITETKVVQWRNSKTNKMCVVVKVELDLSHNCMHRTGIKQGATVVSFCYSLSFCCNRNRTETERGTGTETEQKVTYSCCKANIHFCSCLNHVIFCCNRNQINRKKQTVIWFEQVMVVH